MKLYSGEDKKIKYQQFCDSCGDIPVFSKPWWLDYEVGKNGWDVILVETNHNIIAALPFCYSKLKFFKGIGMPPLAPYQGHYISYQNIEKSASKLAWEEKIVKLLYSNLPKHSFYFTHLFPEIKNWSPIKWLGFQQTTKYSFILSNLQDQDAIFNNFENRARTAIRKAEKHTTIKEEGSPTNLINLTKATYQKQNLQPPYNFDRFSNLIQAAIESNVGQILTAFDKNNNPLSAALIVYDRDTAFFIVQSSQPDSIKLGSASLLVWKSIQEASKRGMSRFDFTGSMMPNVAKYLRSFGANPEPRHYIHKENSFLLYWLMRIKEYMNQN